MGSCCSSNKAVEVGLKETTLEKAENNVVLTENIGHTAGIVDSVQGNSDIDRTTNGTTAIGASSFTISPKYTSGSVIRASPNKRHQTYSTSPRTDKDNNLITRNSNPLHTPIDSSRTNRILNSVYGDFRPSPYPTSRGNYLKENRTKNNNLLNGFSAPAPHCESEEENFDSDLEVEEEATKSTGKSEFQDDVSLGSLLATNHDKGLQEYGAIQNASELISDESKPPENAGEQIKQHSRTIRPDSDSKKRLKNVADNIEALSKTTKIEAESRSTKISETKQRRSPIPSPSLQRKTNTLGTPLNKRRTPSPGPRTKQVQEPDPIMETLEDCFYRFARYGEVNNDGKEMNNKNWAKLCRDCDFVDNHNILVGDVDVIFSRHKPKGFRLIDFDMFVKCLDEVADKKHKSTKDLKRRREKIYNRVIGKAPEYVGITEISKTGNVERMTDHMLYPATHKMRFDVEGHGLGVEEKFSLDPSEMGYVQGYRDTNTYDLKVGRPSSRSSLRPVSRERSNLSSRAPSPQ